MFLIVLPLGSKTASALWFRRATDLRSLRGKSPSHQRTNVSHVHVLLSQQVTRT
jgi:hypothetical protein